MFAMMIHWQGRKGGIFQCNCFSRTPATHKERIFPSVDSNLGRVKNQIEIDWESGPETINIKLHRKWVDQVDKCHVVVVPNYYHRLHLHYQFNQCVVRQTDRKRTPVVQSNNMMDNCESNAGQLDTITSQEDDASSTMVISRCFLSSCANDDAG